MASLLGAPCIAGSFETTTIFGAEILSINASLVTNYNVSIDSTYLITQPAVEATNVTFCNVTVSYTHPGVNDNIVVESWLPVGNWNGRFLAVGGEAWAAGRASVSYIGMEGAVAEGYATSTTDAGLAPEDAPAWALLSTGNVALHKLQNFASTSLNEQSIITKAIIKSFYKKPPDFSYWNGCSQGGRQGLMLAQRYPTAYDGIASGAPVINWAQFLASIQWPQQVMNMIGSYPHACELVGITEAAIRACDGLDRIIDGIISDTDHCLDVFDPFSTVGTTVYCNETGAQQPISVGAATVANATWHGLTTAEGKAWWYGLEPGAGLTIVAATNCTSGDCVGESNFLWPEWFQYFLAKDPSSDAYNLTQKEFDSVIHASVQEYRSVINTDDADLSGFYEVGGKLVTFHGLADEILPPKGTRQYYREVSSLFTSIKDFYRHFEIPGMGHCGGGSSGQPVELFAQLRAWVENGVALEQSTVNITDSEGMLQSRILCPYPQTAQLNPSCGDTAKAQCWSCIGSLL